VHLNAPAILEALWVPLFRLQQSNGVSLVAALVTLLVAIAGAGLILERRVRAWEIVR
jgi:hypothetical protein